MKFFRDSDDLSNVLWYFVPASKNCIPFGHAFGDTVWSLRNNDPPSSIGELPEGHGYSKGFPPPIYANPESTTFCGSEDQWQNGARLTDPVPVNYPGSTLPVCCPEAITVEPLGGTSFGRKFPANPCLYAFPNPLPPTAVVTWPAAAGCPDLAPILVPCPYSGHTTVLFGFPATIVWRSAGALTAGGKYIYNVFCLNGLPNIGFFLSDPSTPDTPLQGCPLLFGDLMTTGLSNTALWTFPNCAAFTATVNVLGQY